MAEETLFEQHLIHLSRSGEPLCTEQPDRFYRVERGSVYVYIVKLVRKQVGERVFLCEISATNRHRAIPTLVFRDKDYQEWRILITPTTGTAEISEILCPPTNILLDNFIEKTEITNYTEEGFENALVEYAKTVPIEVPDNMITDSEKGSPVYRALDYACSASGISLLSWKEIVKRCGRKARAVDIANVSQFICRKVVLDAGWYKGECGPLLCNIGKEWVDCVPGRGGKYQIYRASDSSEMPLTEELALTISPQAYSLGRTLPMRKLKRKDILDFCIKSISRSDLIYFSIMALVCALIGVLLPTLNQMIYDDYIPIGNVGYLAQICVMLLTFMIGNIAFSIVKNLLSFRVTSRVGNELQNAAYHRIFHLPESFFRTYDSADLANRIMSVGALANSFASGLVITAITSLFSIVYLIRMFSYSAKLSWIGAAMYIAYILIMVAITLSTRKGEERIQEASADASSKLYQYLNGVDKIRMAGVEQRAILSYLKPYATQQNEEYKVNQLYSVKSALNGVITSIFSIVLYLVIVKSKISLSVGAFVAFNSAFGAFTGALDGLVEECLNLLKQRALLNRCKPLFESAPENDGEKEIPGELQGSIKLEHVSFSYEQGGKLVLDDMNLEIKDGEYVGIVGSSGCGKSTLLKLLLGFESPQKGMVLVGGKNLASLDKGAYRRQLGVVLQNGKLISGSIYENITITAPNANMKRVNEVIAQVGLKDDIAKMPMGIHTVLSENSNTISGGQQQRILIARAIIGSPKILIFDEATSALDNLTQKTVSENLDKMNVTRIVVAHRLSTIINCDRILALKDGKIIEEGTYQELMAKRGFFYALASRQIAE